MGSSQRHWRTWTKMRSFLQSKGYASKTRCNQVCDRTCWDPLPSSTQITEGASTSPQSGHRPVSQALGCQQVWDRSSAGSLVWGKVSLPGLPKAALPLWPHGAFPLCACGERHPLCFFWQDPSPIRSTLMISLGFNPPSRACLQIQSHWGFSLVTQSCLTICNPMNCSTPSFLVHHQLPELTQSLVYWVSDAIQSSHPPLSPPPAFNLSQNQGLFKWVNSSHQVAKVWEFQLQHQSFQWIFRTDFL